MMWPASSIAVTVSLIGVSVSFAAQTPRDPSNSRKVAEDDLFITVADGELADAVHSAIAALGAPAFADRQAATRRLIAVGKAALEPLRSAYRAGADFETRLRIEEIVRDVYLDHYVYGRNAFLGIRQYQYARTHEEDDRIGEGNYGIEIMSVLPNTAAFDAGIEEGDVIVAMDGDPFMVTGARGVDFGALLRARGPGALVTLSILRGVESFELAAVLGTRPRRYYGRGQGAVHEMLSQYEAAFETWWERHFASPQIESEPSTESAAPSP